MIKLKYLPVFKYFSDMKTIVIRLNKLDSISALAFELVRSKAIVVGFRSRDCKFDSNFLQWRKKLEFSP